MIPGRNDPCSCGSGKKYKKCCGRMTIQHAEPDSDVARANAMKRLDQTLDEQLLRFARKRGGPDWLRRAIDSYLGDEVAELQDAEMQIAIPWALYHHVEAGQILPMAQRFHDEQRTGLSPVSWNLLTAQLEAWLSAWEVRETTPGLGMLLVDLLTNEERFVYEVRGSEGLVARDVLLARVVTCNDVSFIAGLHPRPLPPTEADAVVKEMRRVCRVRTRPVAVQKLKQVSLQLVLLDLWSMAVLRLDHRPPPTLQNTDGDPFLLTTDRFDVNANNRTEVIERLSRVIGAEEPEEENDETVIVMTKPGNAKMTSWDNTVIGRFVITAGKLSVESNSTNRANALRAMVEQELGSLVMHRLRHESSAAQLLETARAAPLPRGGPSPHVVPPELKAMARQMKEAHMLGWTDEAIPALGGLTPREAAAMPKSRGMLDVLLKEIEHSEASLPADERFDVAKLRGSLGM